MIEIAGYLSGAAILYSFAPYIRDIFKGKTKPERISWLIWGVIGLISFFSQMAKGASYSLIMTGVQALGDIFIFILAIKYGMGGFLKRDIFGLFGSAVGLFMWYLTKEAAVALFIIIFVDAVGAVLTVIKSYEHPSSETVSSWAFTFLGGLFACFAVGSLNFILLAFPLYICLASLSILTAMGIGFKHKVRHQYEVNK